MSGGSFDGELWEDCRMKTRDRSWYTYLHIKVYTRKERKKPSDATTTSFVTRTWQIVHGDSQPPIQQNTTPKNTLPTINMLNRHPRRHILRRRHGIDRVNEMGRIHDDAILAYRIEREAESLHVVRRDVLDGLVIVWVAEDDLRCISSNTHT